MKQKPTLVIFQDLNTYGETEFFFNGDEVITGIDGNDGEFRPEYMNCLFESFGVQVQITKKLNPTQAKNLKAYCAKYNIEEAS